MGRGRALHVMMMAKACCRECNPASLLFAAGAAAAAACSALGWLAAKRSGWRPAVGRPPKREGASTGAHERQRPRKGGTNQCLAPLLPGHAGVQVGSVAFGRHGGARVPHLKELRLTATTWQRLKVRQGARVVTWPQ